MTKLMIYDEDHGFWSKSRGWVTESADAMALNASQAKGFVLPTPKSIWTRWRDDLKVHDGSTYRPINDDLALLRHAREIWQKDGEVEVDIPSEKSDQRKCVSRGAEDGAYVLAWVWVPWDEVEPTSEKV